jgi:uncharacterized protein YwqG
LKVDEALREMQARAAPCVRLVGGGAGRSTIGGVPDLAADIPWPTWNGRCLSFLAQLDLAELRAAQGPDWLPERGLLFFFYDEEQGNWGFSPDDRGSAAVLYDPNSQFPGGARTLPQPPPALFPAQPVAMRPHLSLPTPERLKIVSWDWPDADLDALDAQLAANEGDGPLHQVGGWPHPIQNDNMELECQLASNGVDCGGPDGYRSEKAQALRPGAAQWRLLLQLDSDEASDMMWGDSGMLYFWIREADARAGDFSKVWLILQCC